MSQPVAVPMLKRKCPICGKPSVEATKPFCSKRCADVDLGKWFAGSYAAPVVELDDVELPDEESN